MRNQFHVTMPERRRRAIVPFDATIGAMMRSVAAWRRSRIGNASEFARAAHRVAEEVRSIAGRALARCGDFAARLWEWPRPRSRSRAVTALAGIAVIAACLYAGFAAVVYFSQRSLMYFPETVHTTPEQAGFAEAEEVSLTASDGQKIIAWHVAPRDRKPVILYFHGNGGALRYRVERFRKLIADGVGLVALEYRGYGGSTGEPTEAGLIADAQATYDFAAPRYPSQLVLWGESLGSGVAVALAAQNPVGRVILEAPFTSTADVAARHYWYLPVRFLMKDQFHSDERIRKVTAPLLILHGLHDQTVPYAMGERLFDLANKPKHIVRFLDGGHEDLDANGALNAVGRFLAGDLD